jgi:hypothetical protein
MEQPATHGTVPHPAQVAAVRAGPVAAQVVAVAMARPVDPAGRR